MLHGFINPLTYIWKAKYSDSTELYQIDSNGKEHFFSEINQSKLMEFSWIPTIPNLKTYTLHLNFNQRLIAFKRNILSAISGTQTTIYALGFQQTICNQNIKSIIWISKEETKMSEEI